MAKRPTLENLCFSLRVRETTFLNFSIVESRGDKIIAP